MFKFLNNIFRTTRKTLGKVPFLRPKNNLKEQWSTTMEQEIMTATPTEEQQRKERRARIKARTHKYKLNRADRRFLDRIFGEKYPSGSKTTKELFRRVQFLKNLKISVRKKRLVGSKFILTGQF